MAKIIIYERLSAPPPAALDAPAFDPATLPGPPAPPPAARPQARRQTGAGAGEPTLTAPLDPATLAHGAPLPGRRRLWATPNLGPPAPPPWGPVLPSSSLLDGLVSYWKLEETGLDARADSHGANHLASNIGTYPLQAAGKLGFGQEFDGSDDYLEKLDNASLSTGDIDFTFQAWVKTAATATQQAVISKGTIGSTGEYLLEIGPTGVARWRVENSSGTSATVSSIASLDADTWYHVVAWHDSSTNVIALAINDGTPATTAHSTGVRDGANDFQLGLRTDGGTPFDGVIDSVGFWKRLLTSGEISQLYNGGDGLEYPFDGAAAFNPATVGWGPPQPARRRHARATLPPALAYAGEPTLTDPFDAARLPFGVPAPVAAARPLAVSYS